MARERARFHAGAGRKQNGGHNISQGGTRKSRASNSHRRPISRGRELLLPDLARLRRRGVPAYKDKRGVHFRYYRLCRVLKRRNRSYIRTNTQDTLL